MLPPDAVHALTRAFAPAHPGDDLDAGEPMTLEDVRAYLIGHVTYLLDRNPALLMSILYRIDVAERDVKQAFGACTPHELPGRLADLLIERQLQKLRLRARHRDGGD